MKAIVQDEYDNAETRETHGHHAIPHIVVLAFLWPSFVMVTVIAGACVLITGRYPQLFGLIVGAIQWTYRVVAHDALLTDSDQPFRLDLGGSEPAPTTPLPLTTVAQSPEPSGCETVR